MPHVRNDFVMVLVDMLTLMFVIWRAFHINVRKIYLGTYPGVGTFGSSVGIYLGTYPGDYGINKVTTYTTLMNGNN